MMKFNRIAVDFALNFFFSNVLVYLESRFQNTSLGGRFAYLLVDLEPNGRGRWWQKWLGARDLARLRPRQ